MTDVRERQQLPILGVDEALELVLAGLPTPGTEEIPLEAARGRVLAEEIRSSASMPPFDRTAMDGFAVRAEDVGSPPALLDVIEEVPAGRDPGRTVGRGQAARIMTGAMIPKGADAIVMVEHTESLDDGRRVRILRASKQGAHIRRAGEDLAAGAHLLAPGTRLGAAGMGLLAAEGRGTVRVARRPSVAVLSTGDELVPLDAAPRGSQIRETNSWSLRALLGSMGIEPALLGIARDERSDISSKLAPGLERDVLLVSGGVSMGEYDLVGSCLREAGCRAIFERVAIQPGKPLFFGRLEGRSAIVFGLPGNPVSSIVDFLVFVRPALSRMMGESDPADAGRSAILTAPVRRHPGRRGYLPARLSVGARGLLEATPVPSMGSADLVALSRADAFLIAPEDLEEIPAGAAVRILPIPQ